jgi:hypothetical protein
MEEVWTVGFIGSNTSIIVIVENIVNSAVMKQPRREADHETLSTAQSKNERICTSTPYKTSWRNKKGILFITASKEHFHEPYTNSRLQL